MGNFCFSLPRGHRRVWDADLAAFMRLHNIPVPAALEAGADDFLGKPFESAKLGKRLVSLLA